MEVGMNRKMWSPVLFILGLVGALLFILFRDVVSLPVAILLKVLPTLMMCLWLIMMSIDKSNWMILVGLIFSMLCDVSMALRGDIFLIGGIAANMTALIFYTLYFVNSDRSLDLVRVVPPLIVIGVVFFILFEHLGPFLLPVLLYCLIYVVFMWRSAARLGDPTISEASQYACYIGSTAVTVSDALLSALIFKVLPEEGKYQSLVMILWWSGLFLLMVTAEIKRKGRLTHGAPQGADFFEVP